MNFIEAVKKFYSADKGKEEIFIVRESWNRSKEAGDHGSFWALELYEANNLCANRRDRYGRSDVGYWSFLEEDDFLADDWRVFNANTWEMEG